MKNPKKYFNNSSSAESTGSTSQDSSMHSLSSISSSNSNILTQNTGRRVCRSTQLYSSYNSNSSSSSSTSTTCTRSSASTRSSSSITGSMKNIMEKEELKSISSSPLVSLLGGQSPGTWLSPPTTSEPASQRSSAGSSWEKLSSGGLSIRVGVGDLHGVAEGPVRGSGGIYFDHHYSYQPGNIATQAGLPRTTRVAQISTTVKFTTTPHFLWIYRHIG